jgi:DNA polymerase-3 subunit alpha
MEDILKETYGVTVYQEQVMLLSQKLAGFSQGKADELRKAMGKKIRSKLDELKPLFISGCAKNGHDVAIAEKIWKDWEAFAEYAFNKSHATCYAVLAFQTAYLKAHYPAEFMAAVLSNNMDNIKEVSFFMEECKRMGLKVLGPDINESQYRFTVNKNGEVRFGLGAIKGVGEGAVECIVTEREKNGPYTSFFDLTSRVDLRQVNKKTLEALVLAGAFDCFKELHRAQYFAEENMSNLIEKAIRYGNMIQDKKRSTQISLFGESIHVTAALPRIPECEEWTLTEKLNKEKEVVGIYLSEHPLDAFKLTINYCCNATMADLKRIEDLRGMELRLAGMVVDFFHNTSKNGTPYGTLTLEDYSDKQRFFLFGNDYVNFRKYFNKGDFLYVKGRVQPRREKKQENGTSQYEKTQPEQFEFKVLYIDLLSEVIHKEFRSAIFRIPFHEVTDELVNELTLLVQQHPGNFDVYVQLIDTSEKQEVTLHAPRFRIALNNKFHEQISRLPCVELVLN